MSVLLLTYANNAEKPLTQLSQEEEGVYRALRPLENEGFRLHRESNATPDVLIDRIRHYRDRLILFSYSGHASSQTLETQGSPAHAPGLSGLLGGCRYLQVVLLNGCATAGQVQDLHDAGVPVVIATHDPVGDGLAKRFAVTFFEELRTGAAIERAVKVAKDSVLTTNDSITFTSSRDIDENFGTENGDLWGVFYREDIHLSWTLFEGKMVSGKARNLEAAAANHPEAFRVFVIGNQQTIEVYKKIAAALSTEKAVVLNDGWGSEQVLHRETYISELSHSQAVVLLINDPDFNQFWAENPWIEENLKQQHKPFLFIRIEGASQTKQSVWATLGHVQGEFPVWSSITLKALLESHDHGVVYTEMLKSFLIQKIEEIRHQRSIAPHALASAFIEFDLISQKEAFKTLIEEPHVCKFVLFQGTGKCGQNLLKFRLLKYLHSLDEIARSRPWYLPFKSGLEIVDEPRKFWSLLARELDVEDDEPAFVIRLLYNKLKQQDAVLILDEIYWQGIDGASTVGSTSVLCEFWDQFNRYFPTNLHESIHRLYIFGINRATDCQCDFYQLQLEDPNPHCKSLILPTLPLVEERFLEDWHLEQGGHAALNMPEFRNLLEHREFILSDPYLENVITRIGEKLNCPDAVTKVLA